MQGKRNKQILQSVAPLFSGWDETLIRSVLQGHMGDALANDPVRPTAAQLVLGDFCFFAGEADATFAASAAAREIVPQNERWQAAIEQAFGSRLERRLRYAIKKEPNAFSRNLLKQYIAALPEEFELCLFDEAIVATSFLQSWSKDFCGCFQSASDFLSRGIGVAALRRGEFVAGASSYCVYDGGFEIEIDTKPDFRRLGLASACGARLILEALDRNLYPSWDAYDLRSVSLAEKLGYHLDHPYVIYLLEQGQ